MLGAAHFDAKTHQATPQWTYPVSGGVVFVLAPGDFAVQYDINPVYQNGMTGAGQTIAIVSASNVDLSLVQAYQNLFGLTANLPQVVVDGEDPGVNDAATEAYLDLEIAGSVAPGATLLLYTSAGTATTDGLALAALRAVEDDQASVISTSYGECESQLGAERQRLLERALAAGRRAGPDGLCLDRATAARPAATTSIRNSGLLRPRGQWHRLHALQRRGGRHGLLLQPVRRHLHGHQYAVEHLLVCRHHLARRQSQADRP